MKRTAIVFIPLILLLVSCYREVERSRLLEFRINGQYYSFSGYATRYYIYKGGKLKAYGWKIYDKDEDSLVIRACDTTLTKNTYNVPAFNATYYVKPDAGDYKIYDATNGEFRLLGMQAGDIIGDYHCTVKNRIDSKDSIMIQDGYFRIWLDYQDSVLTK